MTSKSSRSVLSMEEYKAVLAEASSLEKPYSETGHLYPVNELLLWVQLLQHPVLLPPVVPLYLCLPDSTLLDKLCFVGQAGQHHLITSEVDIRVRKNIENFGEDLLDQLVSFVEGPGHTCHQFCLHPVPCF